MTGKLMVEMTEKEYSEYKEYLWKESQEAGRVFFYHFHGLRRDYLKITNETESIKVLADELENTMKEHKEIYDRLSKEIRFLEDENKKITKKLFFWQK